MGDFQTECLRAIAFGINSKAPIYRLPPEILVKVLEAREGERELIAASRVSREWRKTLTGASVLWNGVYLKRAIYELLHKHGRTFVDRPTPPPAHLVNAKYYLASNESGRAVANKKTS